MREDVKSLWDLLKLLYLLKVHHYVEGSGFDNFGNNYDDPVYACYSEDFTTAVEDRSTKWNPQE